MICSLKLSFSTGCVTVLTIVSAKRVPPDSKMGTEIVGTLTHADAPQQGNAPHSAPHPACVYYALQYTYEIIFCGCYACGPIRMREQSRMTLKTSRLLRHPRRRRKKVRDAILLFCHHTRCIIDLIYRS
jgi:hypothetical protein